MPQGILGDIPMNLIDYRFEHPDGDGFKNLQEFALTFDHHIVRHPQTNVFSHWRDGVLFGYSEHEHIPVVYPAFHPLFTKASDVLQVMRDWRASFYLGGKIAHIGVPTENCSGRVNFPESVMNKIGLTRLNRELYGLSK